MSGPFRLAAAAAILLPAPALAGDVAASASGAAAAVVVGPVTVRQIADLDFGTVAADAASPGWVTLEPGGGGAIYSGGARQACGTGPSCPAPHAARFEVTGEAYRAYAIAAPDSLTLAGDAIEARSPAPVLTIERLRIRSASRPGAGPMGQLDAAGRDSFDLGGSLHLPSALAPARYRVSVEVIVTYS